MIYFEKRFGFNRVYDKRFDSHREKKGIYNLLVFNNLSSNKSVIYF